jgi:TatA/E family protein of Tat protein translocase
MNILAFGIRNLRGPDLFIILLIVLVLFGGKKLHDLARSIGQSMNEFKKAREDFDRDLDHSGTQPQLGPCPQQIAAVPIAVRDSCSPSPLNLPRRIWCTKTWRPNFLTTSLGYRTRGTRWAAPDFGTNKTAFTMTNLRLDGRQIPLRTRSLVGLIPLIAVEVIETSQIEKMPGFKKRMDWFFGYRGDLNSLVTYGEQCSHFCHRMLAIPGIDFLSAIPLDSYRCDRAPRGIGFKARYHCICKQLNIRMFERRFDATDVCIRVGIDQTRKTVARAEADAAAFLAVFFIQHDTQRCMKRLQTQPREVVT